MDPHNYLLLNIDGKILRGLFEHQRLKLVIVRTGHWQCNQFSSIETSINFGVHHLEVEIL